MFETFTTQKRRSRMMWNKLWNVYATTTNFFPDLKTCQILKCTRDSSGLFPVFSEVFKVLSNLEQFFFEFCHIYIYIFFLGNLLLLNKLTNYFNSLHPSLVIKNNTLDRIYIDQYSGGSNLSLFEWMEENCYLVGCNCTNQSGYWNLI